MSIPLSPVSEAATGQRRRFPLVVLLTANGISMIGNQLSLIAVPWFVLQTTGSPTLTGIAAFAEAVPAVVAAFFGGAVVDRLGFKRGSVAGDLLSGISVALVPAMYYTVGLAYWQLLILIFLANFFDIPGTTARSALLPDLAAAAGMPIERAASAIQAIERGSRLVGAPLAGLLIAVIGSSRVLWLDAATFAASALLVAWGVPAVKLVVESSGRYFADLWEGVNYLLKSRVILALTVLVMFMNFVDTPFGSVVLPVYVQRTYHNPLALGLMFAASGLGAVIGALLFAAYGHRLPRRAVFLGGLVLIVGRYVVFALLPPVPVLIVTQLICGLGAGPLNPILSSIEYERIPVAIRGRVLGAITASAFLVVPLGLLLGGVLVDRLGVRELIIFFGAGYFTLLVIMLVSPVFRDMDAPRPHTPIPVETVSP